MTIREYAKSIGFEIAGSLIRKIAVRNEYDFAKDTFVEKREVYWMDEAGNEYCGNKKEGFCIITADGDVI